MLLTRFFYDEHSFTKIVQFYQDFKSIYMALRFYFKKVLRSFGFFFIPNILNQTGAKGMPQTLSGHLPHISRRYFVQKFAFFLKNHKLQKL